jgi:hypothetical protein
MTTPEEKHAQEVEAIKIKVLKQLDGEHVFMAITALYECLNFVLCSSENISYDRKKQFIEIINEELNECLAALKEETKNK